jgi:hypothetical protein
MSDLKPMPRAAVVAAGWLILLSAVGGLALGVSRNLKGVGGADGDTGEVVAPIKTVANAQPLTAPPVTEADVRRWTREEMQASAAARAPKKKADDTTDTGDSPPAPGAPVIVNPTAPATVTPPKPPQQTQQIPF